MLSHCISRRSPSQGERKLLRRVSLALFGLIIPAASLEAAKPDFNGDGKADLAVGVQGESIGTAWRAGAVNVIYGSATSLTAVGNQFWHQDSPGIADTAENGDGFGSALAWGDFNNDGFTDIAIGVPGEDIVSFFPNSAPDGGAVHVLYGSASGLTATGSQEWWQNSANVLDSSEKDDRFGAALASGDFNGDGYADLAIGVPGEGFGSLSGCGAVHILFGSASGLTATGNQLWSQDSFGILDVCESGDHFGSALAAGDFNGDGKDDLAVGIPEEDVVALYSAGAVSVLYGSATGLTATADQFWNQNSTGILDVSEGGSGFGLPDVFGAALASGDFNGDGRDDLAIGVPGEDSDQGAVNVIYGSATGLSSTGNQFWHQNVSGVPGVGENWDHFGIALAAGDFNGDGRDDLAVGVPGDGSVNVLYGFFTGLVAAGSQLWNQDSSGIPGSGLDGEFGMGLVVADFNGNGRADLAIGAPCDLVSNLEGGSVTVIYGGNTGLTSTGSQLWTQNSFGILDTSEHHDAFGWGPPCPDPPQ
jgi:hypothetical protein